MKESKPSTLKFFLYGGVAGVASYLITVIVVVTIMAVADNPAYGTLGPAELWVGYIKDFISYDGVIYALVLGFPGGGIGGLFFEIIGKTMKAAIIGGIIAGIILVPVSSILFIFLLLRNTLI